MVGRYRRSSGGSVRPRAWAVLRLIASSSGSAGTTPDFECPGVSVRAGAGTLSMSAGAAEDAAMNLRYQVGIGQTARECKLNGTTLTIRVGVQGRVILGPAGGPGQIDEYIVYVGFDPQGAREPAKRPQRTPSRRPPA